MMPYKCLENLQPKEFFHWFGVISAIPRPSYKEEKLIRFLESFAAERSIPCQTDEVGNVFMTVPASQGYETQPSILMQAHMDVVPNKDDGKEFCFETDPIPLYVDGTSLKADGTILGADNGVGVATMLAVADSKDIPHPELELLFTVSEEVGLVGIHHFDCSKIRARRMLNMDSGESHKVCVCSAGKISSEIKKEFAPVPVAKDYVTLRLNISGLAGGHAAVVAKQGRGCAPSFLAIMLKDIPLQLAYFEALGSTVYKNAVAEICVPAASAAAVKEKAENVFAELKAKYAATDPDAHFMIEEVPDAEYALSEKDSADVITSLYAHRSQGRCPDSEGRVTASSIIMKAVMKDGKFEFTSLIRALQDSNAQAIFDELLEAMPLKMTEIDRYSGWPERVDSPFRELFQKYHKNFFGEELVINRALGGLEVGPILGAIPDMDAVGYAPSSYGAHTTKEYLDISQTPSFWKILLAVLAHKV